MKSLIIIIIIINTVYIPYLMRAQAHWTGQALTATKTFQKIKTKWPTYRLFLCLKYNDSLNEFDYHRPQPTSAR